jgi:UDP-glucose 4-epimerase
VWQGSFNVGTGVETSVSRLYELMGSKPPLHGPAKAGEQMRSVLDGRKLRALAALPQPRALGEGLAATMAWFRTTPALPLPGG